MHEAPAKSAAETQDPCEGIAPCDLGGDFTIDEIVRQPRRRISGICVSRCFWQAVVTDTCVDPDAIVKIHAPFDPKTGEIKLLAAEILISETKSPQLQQYLRESGAGYQGTFTELTGRDLIKMGVPACALPFEHGTFAPPP
jgi:hypothetical protein